MVINHSDTLIMLRGKIPFKNHSEVNLISSKPVLQQTVIFGARLVHLYSMNNICNNRPYISDPEAKTGLAHRHHTSCNGLIVHLLPHYSELQSLKSAWKFMFIHQTNTDRRWCGGD